MYSIQHSGLQSGSEVESPTSPGYDYAYTDSRPTDKSIGKPGMGNPMYSSKLPISEPFYNDLEPEQEPSQPVYHELVGEQVYMDPNAAQSEKGGQQEQPIYRELDETPHGNEAPGSPIYREIDEAPVYAETTESPGKPGNNATEALQYQELSYASTKNVYQPLSDDWKSKKYNQ